MKKILLATAVLFTAALALVGCQSAPKEEKVSIDYELYTLANGLKVVLHQDHSDPIIALAIQFHVGSGREKPGKTGFAHFFEHMLFQRSENLPRNSFFQKISGMGGDFNGGTGPDGTIYYETVPRDALEKVLWMESDRMGFFINTVTQAGLDREIDVILNEKRQTADNVAYGQLGAITAEEMYPAGHPYSWDVIGKMDDIRSATIPDVKEFYATYYIPQNATLSLAGDFDLEQAKALIQKYFGEIPAGKDIEKPKVWIPELTASKKVMYEDPFAPLPMLYLSYPSVEQYHEDAAALSMLGQLLSGSKNAPMYKTIVEANLAPSVYVGNMAQEVAGEFAFQIQAYEGKTADELYQAIQDGFALFEKNGIDAQEMQRIKVMQERNAYNRLASVYGKASQLARGNEYGGKPDRFIDELEATKALTEEDIMRVYNQYVKGKNFLAVTIVPKGQPQLAMTGSVPAKVEVENVEDASSQQTRSKAGAIVDDDYPRTPSSFDRSVEPGYLANSPQTTLPVIWNSQLGNGMKLSGISQHEVPLVTFNITIKGGRLLEPLDKAGLARLSASLMNEGTALRTAEEIETALGLLGANASAYSSETSMGIQGSCLARNLAPVMDIVEEMLLQPRFDQEALVREKNKALAIIAQQSKEQSYQASMALVEKLFGKDNYYSTSSVGTKESIDAITMDDIKAYYKQAVTPANAAMLITGAVDQETAQAALASLATNWQGQAIPVVYPPYESTSNFGKTYFVDYPGAKQSVIIIGGFSKPYSDPDWAALEVLNFKLGSGSNGLLFDVLRLQRGYTYGAYSSFSPSKNYGIFTANSSVQSTVTKESVGLFRDILSQYGANFSQELLDASKDALLRSQAFAYETQRSLLNLLSTSFLNDLPQDYVIQQENTIKNVTLEQIKAFAAQYLDQNNLVYVVSGDAKTQLKNVQGAELVK